MMRMELAGADFASGATPDVDALHIAANGAGQRSAWHDVFAIADECSVVSIGDIAGGPAEAAAIRNAVRAVFNDDAEHAECAPGEHAECAPGENARAAIATQLARAADAILGRPHGVGAPSAKAIVGIIDCRARTFTYFSAGQQPPFLRGYDGTIGVLPADAAAAESAQPEHPPAQVVVDLNEVADLFLYSSAFAQSLGGPGGDMQHLHDALTDERMNHHNGGISWLARELLADRAHDDAALVKLRFPDAGDCSPTGATRANPWPAWTVSWSFNATAAALNGARRAFLACLSSKVPAGRAIDLCAAELIYGELLGNVVRHAPGIVEISLDWTADLPVLHVRDNGPGFRSRRSRERLPVDELSESGRGLFIINALAAKFSVHNANGRGTHASVTLPLA